MRKFWRISIVLAGLVATIALGIAASGFGAFYYLSPSLPSVEEMREIPLQIPLRIYSRDGRLLDQIGEKRRSPIDYDEIPHIVRDAFLAAEDDRFFDHPGFDYQGIMRAALNMLKTGTRAQGGSTITQQLAREYFLTRDRTFARKAKELILATQIENEFSKEEILELYLNKIFLGQRAYGVVAAASVYFGKTLDELTVAEAATLAGLPAAPSRLNPVSSAQLATERRAYVLRRMHELAFIDDEQLAAAIATPMMSREHGPRIDLRAPYIAEMVRAYMIERYGDNAAYTDGYQVVTTLDSTLQRAADLALRKALFAYDRIHTHTHSPTLIDTHTHSHSPTLIDTHTLTYTHLHSLIHTHTHLHSLIHTHTHLHSLIHTHSPTLIDTHTHSPTLIDTHTHTPTLIDTHTHTLTYTH